MVADHQEARDQGGMMRPRRMAAGQVADSVRRPLTLRRAPRLALPALSGCFDSHRIVLRAWARSGLVRAPPR
jgi:hypothetical protein